ncbi:winged helix-turn-helix transcriptional regulator [Flavivirga algicola]|uniref:Helix-turn-helix transcriptional regulator n=1 Tax=Flavivirga algicola TaxID=2729136 RepID=A0ABX1RUY3_9FLAO|nr:helix-turn-helix domain-containing protein [Flavivirga algicola]NMH86858.1 helix-turn-helix transcriptional regulator [Flavivirga algicola]
MRRKLIDNPNGCTITHAMNIIGNKWTPIIIYVLGNKTYRFGELAVRTGKISRKVLANQLKEMEECGILIRRSYDETPKKVEYRLTQKGKELLPILDLICSWSEEISLQATPD